MTDGHVPAVSRHTVRTVGRELGSATVVAASTQTMPCTYPSAVLLLGLGVDATLGWSRVDPLAALVAAAVALVVAAVALREGVQAWRGEGCGRGPGCTDGCCRPAVASADALGIPVTPRASRPGTQR